MTTENLNHTQNFPVGNALYPDGRVIVTDDQGTTEYTLEEWAELQQQQQS